MLMRTAYRALRSTLPVLIVFVLFLLSGDPLKGQTNNQLPSPTGQINDFAGVVDPQSKGRLESLLANLKAKTKVAFYVVTVDTTGGQDIFKFSQELAASWNIGSKTSSTKTLLLVISVGSKTSFTQFSRLAQADLPEGVLGEMSQRMRTPLSAGRFSEAIDEGVLVFVSALAEKHGLAVRDLDKPVGTADAAKVAEVPTATEQSSDPPVTRPRVVKETKPSETETTTPAATEPQPTKTETTSQRTPIESTPQPIPTDTSQPATAESTPKPTTESASESNAPKTKETEKRTAKAPVRDAAKPPKNSSSSAKLVTPAPPPVDDEAEAEEVELTLTLPLPKRAAKLKSFLETHPDSKARPRATELLISTHAGLGDQYLKAGDIDAGVKQLLSAIEEADVAISDQLFFGVISQIPSNLYLRGQADAALKAATNIETKFGNDPKRLLNVAGFYVGIERGDEAARIAELAVKLAPDMAEAHRVLALSRHINLQLDEAAAEYKRTVELDPASKASLRSLADLTRANGKAEEALALYNELLKADSKDLAATTGMVICLFELGRKDEANTALDAALATEPRNLSLVSGMAYWYAAHEQYEKAFDFARKAISLEPRYTWSQIALVRSLIGLKRPVGAERAMRFARQYGKFPTLNYELANVVTAMGFYDEAADILRESFSFKNGQIETYLAGHILTSNSSFLDLLTLERKASIYQPTAADSPANAKVLRDLLALDSSLTVDEGGKLDETVAAKAARDFGSGNDSMKTYRQLYAASRLLRKTVALPTALALVEDAKKDLDAALNVSVVTTAVQAEELRDLRANALAAGTVPDMEEAPRSALNNIMRGRIEDLTGWILFNQDKYPEAIEHLKKATTILPFGTPAWRNTMWHLGVAYEQTGSNNEALDNYIKSYNSGLRDPTRRSAIERLYKKVNGSLNGLDDKIGSSQLTTGEAQSTPSTNDAPRPAPNADTTPRLPATTQASEKPAETGQTETNKPESTIKPTAEPTTNPTPTSRLNESAKPPQSTLPSEDTVMAASPRLRSNVRITGRALDSNNQGLANVVVVLISPSGSVISATTDNEGNYSFTVIPTSKTYRVIPSKDGYSFSPVDKAFSGLLDDQKGIDFVGRTP